MKDKRRAPFCFQTLDATAAIRGRFTSKERATAIAIYQAMTEMANELRDEGGRDGYSATRPELAELAGVTVRTLDRYATAFEELGLLQRERHRQGDVNLPNTWILLEPGVGSLAAPPVQPTTHLGQEAAEGQEKTQPSLSGDLEPRSGCQVGRHRLLKGEWATATDALDHFNERAGTNLGKLTSRRDPSPHIKQIVERIREYPELTAAEHREIIDHAFNHPWWKGKPGVGVIYGPRAFPRAVSKERPTGARSYERQHDPEDEPW